jgi:hypothetical protein
MSQLLRHIVNLQDHNIYKMPLMGETAHYLPEAIVHDGGHTNNHCRQWVKTVAATRGARAMPKREDFVSGMVQNLSPLPRAT